MRRVLFLLLCCLVTLSGCGGGGSSVATFTFQIQWNTPTGGIDGQSVLIELFDQNNILKFSTTIDRPTTFRNIFGVPSGTYHLHVNLFAQTGQQGALNGQLDDLIAIGGSSTYSASVGPAVAHVKVTPASAMLAVTHSQQFYATSQTSAHVSTFTAPSGFTWQTLGGVASTDQNGLVVGTSAGPGSVQATNAAVSISGAATLTITPTTTTHTKWTVIVWMNASNNLWPDSILNVNQMERVASNPQVRFVVEWKQSTNVDPGSTFNSTRRYLVKQDTTNAIASEIIQDLGPGYDMGSSANLLDFMNWAKTNYPADHYCVVIWNHGNGWTRALRGRGVSYDDESGNHIDTWQLSQGLGNGVNDIVAWDASLMQQIEVDEEIHDKAALIVGSEESPPEQGYPYDLIFAHLRDNDNLTALALADEFVDETVAFYGNGAGLNITQSVIDTSQLSGLVTATSNLADALSANVGSLGTIVPQVRANAQGYDDSTSEHRLFRDLYDIGLKLENFGAPAAVVTAEQAVRTAVTQAVVHEGHNTNSPGSHGIAIDFHAGSVFTASPPTPTLAQDYQNLRFGQETHWGQWLSIAP